MSTGAYAVDLSVSLVCHLMHTVCISRFLRKHLKGSASEAGVFGMLFFCGYAAAAFLLEREEIPYILYAFCSHTLLAGLTVVVFGRDRERTLMAAVLVIIMTGLLWNFGESFLCCLGLILTNALTGSRRASVGVWGGRSITVMTYVCGLAAIHLLSSPLESVFAGKRKSWYVSLLAPLLCIIFVMDLANWAASNGIMVQAWERYGLYENQLFSHGAMCIFAGLAMAAAGFLVFGMDRIDRAERAREQHLFQVRYYQMMEEQYSRMERLRHDMKNHMIALNRMVQKHQWESAADYLREMAEAGGLEAENEITGSIVLDALLCQKRRQAAEKGIRWQCDARIPGDCQIREIDLCIIVGNVLDNALEACSGQTNKETAFIEVYLGTIRKCLFLEVRNSMEPEGGKEEGSAGKKHPGRHGLGLGNIKAAAAGYNGAMHTEKANEVFTISVLLPLCCQEDSVTDGSCRI